MEKEKINGSHTYKLYDNIEDGDDDEQDEEKKMDKFFALVRNIREARKVLFERKQLKSIITNELEKDQKKPTSTCTTADERITYSSWVPSFELEDFTSHVVDDDDDHQVLDQFIRRPPSILPNPSNKKVKQDHGLDLNLTL
ncbi:hypothetical protein FNV43_RR23675 [Rhamnella rubrinervis]|uniref:NIM1-interacting protein n=1 Tax=Rhamnella rubrinervis TaxID=2594499 RepID=A0A8K0DWK8_9ROSA|nr:hypothetical protein FNV43_RR23675 [Rhamnella rubrinervis]